MPLTRIRSKSTEWKEFLQQRNETGFKRASMSERTTTLPSSLNTHLVACLSSSPAEALVSARDLFLTSHSQHHSQPTTTCIPMMIVTEALYAVNRTVSPSNTDFFFFDQGHLSFWSFPTDSWSESHPWFGMFFLSVWAELTFWIADRRSDSVACRVVRWLARASHHLPLQLQSRTLLRRMDH